jgi:hypothetical protein
MKKEKKLLKVTMNPKSSHKEIRKALDEYYNPKEKEEMIDREIFLCYRMFNSF